MVMFMFGIWWDIYECFCVFVEYLNVFGMFGKYLDVFMFLNVFGMFGKYLDVFGFLK